MCGVFGFITVDGSGPDIQRLKRVALVTQTRGEHAFGLAWVDRLGAVRTFKAAGSSQEHLLELDACRNAVVLIGHCRYATHGSPAQNVNNHPHSSGGGVFVHNGVVGNYEALVIRHQLRPASECDSEVLGLLAAKKPGRLVERWAWAAEQAAGGHAVLGLWAAPARILVARRGRPLHFGVNESGCYLASLPHELPGSVKPVHNDTVSILAWDKGRIIGGKPQHLSPRFAFGVEN